MYQYAQHLSLPLDDRFVAIRLAIVETFSGQENEAVYAGLYLGWILKGNVVPNAPSARQDSLPIKHSAALEPRSRNPTTLAVDVGKRFSLTRKHDRLHVIGRWNVGR